MKKILCTFLIVIMCLTAAPLDGFIGIEWSELDIGSWFSNKAEAANYSGACGDNVEWSYSSYTGILTISGEGEMYNYSCRKYVTTAPWESYASSIQKLVIMDSVTSIGDFTFSGCSGLTSVTISDSVTTIGNCAFQYCDNLTSITIGNCVTTMGHYVFRSCSSLTSITIPNSVTEIGGSAFSGCSSLTSVTIPDGVTTIGDRVFDCCDRLTSVTIPDSVTAIGDEAFLCCTSLTSIILPSSLTTIGDYAFCDCISLTSITIPDSVTTIGYIAFTGCVSLVNVTIGNGVTTIGEGAFSECLNITDVYYGGTEEQWNNISIESHNEELINATIHFNSVNEYNLGDETYSFGNYTKCDCSGNGYGHCFGMSATSSGYYIGHLNKSIVGLTGNETVYSLEENQNVKKPICHYQLIQGNTANNAILAGGTNYKNPLVYNSDRDWKEVVNYIKNHAYDNKGIFQIGIRVRVKEGILKSSGHAVNFLRYDVVNGQERIYVYDNNIPYIETYFYQDSNGDIKQAPVATFGDTAIDCIALRNMWTYFAFAEEFKPSTAIYAKADTISIEGVNPYLMDGYVADDITYSMFEVDEEISTISITPLIDNATFTYMDKEYSFGKIDEDTYAEFTLATSEDDTPEFEIVNEPIDAPDAPEVPEEPDIDDTPEEPDTPDVPEEPDVDDTPEEPCTCKCHGNFIQRLIFKITNFFQKLFGKNKVCACGVAH